MIIDLAEVEVLRDHNSRTHIVLGTGRVNIHAVVLDGSVRYVELPLVARRHLHPLLYKDKPYPLARAVRMLKRIGRDHGITDRARDALKELAT